jgi:hypothetical protein
LLRLFLFVSALGSVGCSKSSSATPAPTPARAPVQATSQAREVLEFQGHIKLDPRTNYYAKEGDVFQYLFTQDGALFDAMLCYPHGNRCALLDLRATGDAQSWSGTLSESVPSINPFVLHFQLPPKQRWQDAKAIEVSVESPGLGEVGATTLTAVAAPAPPAGLRERLRGEQRLRALYAQITRRYAELPAGQRVFPESHAEYPETPPCGPTTVSDTASVAWLGLSAPVVLSWSFQVQADAAQGTLRLTARRDRDCHGDLETLALEAKLDSYGDFEREQIISSAGAAPL